MSGGAAVLRTRWARFAMVFAPIVVVLAIIAVNHRAAQNRPDQIGGAFLPELRDGAADIVRMEVQRGEEHVVVALGDDGWTLPLQDDYPARIERVQEIVRALIALRRERAMTALPARHPELGLRWPDPTGEATLVRLFVAGEDEPLSEIVLGRDRFSPRTQFVRRLGDDQTWRVAGAVTAPASAVQYVSDRLSDLPGRDLLRIEFPGGTIERDDPDSGDDWRVRPTDGPIAAEPDERQLGDAEFALPELLGRLDFDDMRRDEGRPARDVFRFHSTAAAVTIQLIDEDDGIWMRLRWIPVESEDDPSASTIAERMAPYVERWDGWLYRLPYWRATRIRNAAGWFDEQP